MKKLTAMFVLAFLTQGATADINSNYTNLAVLVAETGAVSWSAEKIMHVEHTEKQLDARMSEVNEKLSSVLQERFNNMLEKKMEIVEE